MPNYNGDGLSIPWCCLCLCSLLDGVPLSRLCRTSPGARPRGEGGGGLGWAPSWGPIRASSATKSRLLPTRRRRRRRPKAVDHLHMLYAICYMPSCPVEGGARSLMSDVSLSFGWADRDSAVWEDMADPHPWGGRQLSSRRNALRRGATRCAAVSTTPLL
jgi:hypothetical protein